MVADSVLINAVQGYRIIEALGWNLRVLNHSGCNICNCPSNGMDIHFVGSCWIACICIRVDHIRPSDSLPVDLPPYSLKIVP